MSKPTNFPTKPGIYLADGGAGIFFLELEENGTVHQLTLNTLERDGVLDDAGWSDVWPIDFYGPLARVVHLENS